MGCPSNYQLGFVLKVLSLILLPAVVRVMQEMGGGKSGIELICSEFGENKLIPDEVSATHLWDLS